MIHNKSSKKIDSNTLISLCSWALFFIFIMAKSRLPYYINPHFALLPAFGAVVLIGMAAAVATGAIKGGHGKPTDWSIMMWFVTPIILGILFPPAAVGAFFADKRTSSAWSNNPGDSAITLNLAGGSGFKECDIAQLSDAGHITSGAVSVEGQIAASSQGMPAGEVRLQHYKMTCCIADLRTVQITLKYIPGFPIKPGQWVDVHGIASREGNNVVLTASEMSNIHEPNPPYLY